MPCPPRRTLPLLVALLVLAAAPAVAAAATNLSTPGTDAASEQIAVDPAGDAVVVWLSSDNTNERVQAATRPAGGSWSAPVTVSDAGQDADQPRVAIRSDGEAVAVWSRSDGTYEFVQAAVLHLGTWGTPVDLSLTGENSSMPEVAVDPSGDAVAVWQRTNGDPARRVVQAATMVSGAWSAATTLTEGFYDSTQPVVAIDKNGNAIAAWQSAAGSSGIEVAGWSPAGGWGTPTYVSEIAAADGPRVAFDAAGDATVLWEESKNGQDQVFSNSKPAVGTWARGQSAVSPNGEDAANPWLAVDPAGDAVAAWTVANTLVQASSRSAGETTWGAPVDVSGAQSGSDVRVSLDADGRALAVWRGSDGANEIIRGAVRAADGTWSGPGDLSAPCQDAFLPFVGTGPSGSATATWFRNDGSHSVVQAADVELTSFQPQTTPCGGGGGGGGGGGPAPAPLPTPITAPSSPPPAQHAPPPPVIRNLVALAPCVRGPELTAPTAGANGLAFSFELNTSAKVTYAIKRRRGSRPLTRCPREAGSVPGDVVDVSDAQADGLVGDNTTSLAHTRAVRPGAERIALARLAAAGRLAPGTYILYVVATDRLGRASNVARVKFWVLAERRTAKGRPRRQ